MFKESLFSTSHNIIFCLLTYSQNHKKWLSDAIWETRRIQNVVPKADLCEEITILVSKSRMETFFFLILFFKIYFIYLFLAVLVLRCGARASH